MLKDATYNQKFALLKDFLPVIISEVKKDLKNEHLKNDRAFAKEHFPNKPIQRLSVEELIEAYSTALENEEIEQVKEFITHRWLLKNTHLYSFFEGKLRAIDPNFTELETIEMDKAETLKSEASQEFGPLLTYIFSVLNSVVFPKEVFDKLAIDAKEEMTNAKDKEEQEKEERTLQNLEARYEREMRRLTDKYEKKLLGLQKKYHNDIAALKKQISSLQQKLNEAKK